VSAIAGIYLDDRTVDSADLAKMINILAHRGPDEIMERRVYGMGHRMLWTTRISLGAPASGQW